MNYFHEQKIAYLGLPRTGSRYVFSCLAEAFNDDSMLVHTPTFDPEFKDYTFVCSVRNPYTRVLSSWKWLNMVNQNKYYPESFADYVRCVVPSFMLSVCTTLGPHIEDIDHAVRIEFVEKDLTNIEAFPKDFKFPENGYRTEYKYSLEEYYADAKVRDRIWDVYREDFDKFGYSRHSYVGK